MSTSLIVFELLPLSLEYHRRDDSFEYQRLVAAAPPLSLPLLLLLLLLPDNTEASAWRRTAPRAALLQQEAGVGMNALFE
jgi:hypothetical protein